MIEVCKAMIRDMPHIVRLDTQTQEFALEVEGIKEWFTEKELNPYIARLGGREVGFALAMVDKPKDMIYIARVGVHPKFRRVGIGRKIVERITLEAVTENIGEVNMIVPGYIIDDKEDPWNIEQWLWKLGFKATKVVPDLFHRYNQDYDGYTFERLRDDTQTIC